MSVKLAQVLCQYVDTYINIHSFLMHIRGDNCASHYSIQRLGAFDVVIM